MPRRKKPARLVFGEDIALSAIDRQEQSERARASLARWTHPAMAPYLRPPRHERAYFKGGSSSLALARNCPCGCQGRLPAGLDPIPPYAGEAVDAKFEHNVPVAKGESHGA